jgi:hypothetical protein
MRFLQWASSHPGRPLGIGAVVLVGLSVVACAGPSLIELGGRAAREGDWDSAARYYSNPQRFLRESRPLLLYSESVIRDRPADDYGSIVPSRSVAALGQSAVMEAGGSRIDSRDPEPAFANMPSAGPGPIAPSTPPMLFRELHAAPDIIGTASAPMESEDPAPFAPAIQGFQDDSTAINMLIANSLLVPGDEVDIQVFVSNASNLFAAPFYFYYDPSRLAVKSVIEGGFLKQDGNGTAFMASVDPAQGRIILGLTRLGPVTGISGSGSLVTVRLEARGEGEAVVAVANANFRDPGLQEISPRITSSVLAIR